MQSINISHLPDRIPVVVHNNFIYPFMISPLFFSDEESISTIEFAIENNLPILVVPQKSDSEEDEEILEKIYPAGAICSIMRKVNLPDGRVKILLQGHQKGIIRDIYISDEQIQLAEYSILEPTEIDQTKISILLDILKDQISELVKYNPKIPADLIKTISTSDDMTRIGDLIVSSLNLPLDDVYSIYIEEDTETRFFRILQYINDEIESSKIQKDIKSRVQKYISQHNREFYLKKQLQEIQKELGIDNQKDEEIEKYFSKLEKKRKYMGEEAYKEVHKQITRLSRMHSESADAQNIQTYIEWVLEIPFGTESKKRLNIQDVENRLNRDHYSLKKPKNRIVEYFAVKELKSLRGIKEKENSGVILCFVGPPGVGKTSLANSIATAMDRKLVRIALGGLEDVNELRGHRRTYVGAMPGRIVQGLINAKSMNPVMVLDEIDKLGRSHRGDPTAVMLEILDPEQNSKFRDYYLNFDIDLSKITFIATANDKSLIPPPLRDRMEFIHISSYTPQEKFHIAKKYLIPQEVKKHGLKLSEISISKRALEEIISSYTREAGVRNLRRRIADIIRKSAKKILENPELHRVSVSIKNLNEFLDKTVFEIEKVDRTPKIGVVYGLAWTAVGGDVLKTEAIKIAGKGLLKLTGKLGDVMKESAQISFSVVKTLFDSGYLQSDIEQVYNKYDLHVHIPDGATPKDGPSAGITMTTAIASILSDSKVRGDTAMTGEVSLHGEVLPIGGLKEKIIAAHKAGIEFVLIPKKNYERDLDDIPDEVVESLEIIPVTRIEEVLDHMLIRN